MAGQQDPFIQAQEDGLRRLGRLLERSQREPDVRLGDTTVVAEILAAREDLLIESRTRYATLADYEAVKRDVAWAVSRLKQQFKITGWIVGFLVTVVSPVLSAVLIRSLD